MKQNQTITFSDLKELIRADYGRLAKRKYGYFIYLLTNASFKVTFWFRIASWLQNRRRLRIVYFLVAVLYKHYQYLTGIQLPIGTDVGGGLFFPHFGTIVINKYSVIGSNCTIYQGVTIGSMRGECEPPKIGKNVVLFSGAKIIGNVIVGDNACVGAGAVVVKNVDKDSCVAGVPAKTIAMTGRDISKLYCEC